MVRIGVIETLKCWWCGATKQTVKHLYARCQKWRKQKKKLVYKLEKKSVKWQLQLERKWLANLLENEKAVTPLLKFLKTMRIKGKKRAKEKKQEWARKHNQEDKNFLK